MADKYNISTAAHDASDNTQWSTTSGGANDTTAPGSSDKAIFDQNSLGVCNFNIVDVQAFEAKALFASTVNVSVAADLGNFDMNGGTVHCGTLAITMNYFQQSGGVFTSTSGLLTLINSTSTFVRTAGTFNHNNGEIKTTGSASSINPNGANFYKLTHNNANGLASASCLSSCNIENKFHIQKGTLTGNLGAVITCQGDLQLGNGAGNNNYGLIVEMNGAGDQEIYKDKLGATGGRVPRLRINKASGTLTIYDELVLKNNSGNSPWIYQQGIVDLVTGNSKITFNGFASTIADDTSIFHNVKVETSNSSVSTTLGANMNIANNLECNSVFIDGGFDISVGGTTVFNGNGDLRINGHCTVDGLLTAVASSDIDINSGGILELNSGWSINVATNLDFNAGSELRMGGDLDIDAASTSYDFDGKVILGWGGVVSDYRNTSNSNRIDIVEIADGGTLNGLGSNMYTDRLRGPDTGLANITGGGSFILQDAIENLANLNIVADVDGGIKFPLSASTQESGDFGNAKVSFTRTSTATLVSGSVDFHCYVMEFLTASQNTTTKGRFEGAINVDVDTAIKIGDTVVQTRGGIMEWASKGTLTCADFDLNLNNGVEETNFVSDNGGDIVITNSFSDAVNTILDLSLHNACFVLPADFIPVGSVEFGNSDVRLPASVDLSTAALVTYDTEARLLFQGVGVVTANLGAVQGNHVTDGKDGGSLTFTSILDISGAFSTCANADSDTILKTGVANACNFIQTFGSGGAKKSIQSDSPGVKFDLAVQLEGPINKHSGWKDSNVTGAIVRVDTLTGSDDGNNTIAGAEGLFFDDFEPSSTVPMVQPITKDISVNIIHDHLLEA